MNSCELAFSKNTRLELKVKPINSEVVVCYNITGNGHLSKTPSLSLNHYGLPTCVRTLAMTIRDNRCLCCISVIFARQHKDKDNAIICWNELRIPMTKLFLLYDRCCFGEDIMTQESSLCSFSS